MPVFYATARQYIGHDGSIEYAEESNPSGLLFGVKNMVVPAPGKDRIPADKLQQMSWLEVHSDDKDAGKRPVAPADDRLVKDRLLTKEEVAQVFGQYADKTGATDSTIFIHGCCCNFETSMRRAAKISAHLGKPVLLYDWVSPTGFTRYLQNEARLSQTIDDFCRFLDKVEEVASPQKISLLGHSMGAQFVDVAMVRRAIIGSLKPLEPYREIIMSNADVDTTTFLKHAKEFVSNGSHVRVYMSTTDDRLEASSLAHGGFTRLGGPGKQIDQLKQVKGLEIVDITGVNTGHEIPFDVVAAMESDGAPLYPRDFSIRQAGPGFFCAKSVTLRGEGGQHTDADKRELAGCGTCN